MQTYFLLINGSVAIIYKYVRYDPGFHCIPFLPGKYMKFIDNLLTTLQNSKSGSPQMFSVDQKHDTELVWASPGEIQGEV